MLWFSVVILGGEVDTVVKVLFQYGSMYIYLNKDTAKNISVYIWIEKIRAILDLCGKSLSIKQLCW